MKKNKLYKMLTGAPLLCEGKLPFPVQIVDELLGLSNLDTELMKKITYLEKSNIAGFPLAQPFINDEPKFFRFNSIPSNVKEGKMGEFGSSIAIDKKTAIIKAFGECVERVCLNKIPKNLIISSFFELKNSNKNILNLADSVNFSDKNYLKGRVSHIQKLKKSKLRWMVAYDVKNHVEILVPAQLVYVPSENNPILKEDSINGELISTGAAFGVEKGGLDAVCRGILECVERDSNMIRWHTKYSAPKVILDTKKTRELEKYFAGYNLKLNVYDLTTDISIPSFMAIITDESGVGPAQTIGSKADLNPEKAVIGAILESQQVRLALRVHRVTKNVKVNSTKEITDLRRRTLYWYEKSMRKHLDFLLESSGKIKLSEIKNQDQGNYKDNVKFLKNKLINKGFDIYIADISVQEVKKLGFHVIKAIIPKLHPLYLSEHFKKDYSQRLISYGGVKNHIPHPFP